VGAVAAGSGLASGEKDGIGVGVGLVITGPGPPPTPGWTPFGVWLLSWAAYKNNPTMASTATADKRENQKVLSSRELCSSSRERNSSSVYLSSIYLPL